MRLAFFSVSCAAALAAFSSAAFAQQIVTGAIPTAVSPTGVTAGVAMTGQGGGGTLTVGTVGGPQTDIFTNNSSGGTVTNALLRAVSTDASSLSNIVFNSSSNVYGAIGATQPGGPFFLNITGGNNNTVDSFRGNVFATITTVAGSGALNFNSGSTNISATNFAGDGTIALAGNTTLVGALTTAAANAGTLALTGGSVLTGAVGGATGLKLISVTGGSNTAGISSSISGAVDSFAFNLSTNTLNIGGALTIANKAANGVINTTLASPSVYGNIRVTGATNLGPALRINVTVPSTAFIPVGTIFNIVQTTAGTLQSGTNGSIVTVVNDPTNPLYTFSAVPASGTIAGLVSITTTGIPLTVPVAPPAGVVLPPAQVIAAPVVDAILAVVAAAPPASVTPPAGGTTTPVTPAAVDLITVVLPAINAIADPVAVVNAIAQLTPANSALAVSLVTFQGTRAFQDLLASHEGFCGEGSSSEGQRKRETMDDNRRPEGASSGCPQNNSYSGLWAKGFGYYGNQGAQGAFQGYDARIMGVMVGYDVPLGEITRVGIGLGYAKSNIKGKVITASTDFNSYQATLYIAHESDTWFADGDVAYGWNNYSGSRRILFTGIDRTAKSSYRGSDFTGFVTTGYHFAADEFSVTPLASLQASFVRLPAFTETGAGDVDLSVAAQDQRFLESGLGLNVARALSGDDGNEIIPQLHAKWLHKIVNAGQDSVAAFTAPGSTSFTTPGPHTAADTLDLGAGLMLLSSQAHVWSVEAIYDHYWRRDNYTAQQVTLAASYRF